MEKLACLPNIGKVLEQKLNDVQIYDEKQLKSLGAQEAFMRVKAIDPTACLHMLYALAGAIKGVRYTHLTQGEKDELRDFLKTLERVDIK